MHHLGTMKLNADLGESYGNWQFDSDADIMPLIDMANIACGGHAGDPLVMHKTISLAAKHQVAIGAHPAYPDIQGFGRRSMRIPPDELSLIIQAQMATLDGMAKCQKQCLRYVKPHGALYNDMMSDKATRTAVLQAVSGFHVKLPLVVQAGPQNALLQDEASKFAVELIFEAFADRLYLDSGLLSPRNQVGAVLNAEDSYEQAKRLIQHNSVISSNGTVMPIHADTICVHGDSPDTLKAAQLIRSLLTEVGA